MNDSELAGAIVVDKPAGWTSHDVVAKMRRIARTKRIGHLGTLDPMATGVLPLLVGRATRLAQFYSESEKAYRARIAFGLATNTYDREGQPLGDRIQPEFTREQFDREIQAFRGEFEQMPPAVSAKKIQGRPAYELARKNIAFELKPVRVCVHELTVESFSGTEAQIFIRCGAGTYIRSIAHDLGQRLGCGAHLSELRRTASSEFTIEQAHTLEELAALSEQRLLEDIVTPPSRLLARLPQETVDDTAALKIRQGQNVRTSPFRDFSGAPRIRLIASDGSLLAIGEVVQPHLYHPICVF